MENEQHIQAILERNKRVEIDKAWELSWLWLIGVTQFWLQAAVPTGGYILSTLSLPWVKRWWVRRQNGD